MGEIIYLEDVISESSVKSSKCSTKKNSKSASTKRRVIKKAPTLSASLVKRKSRPKERSDLS